MLALASELPNALRAALIRLDEFSQGKDTLLKVARIDLNGNHVGEFIVQSAQAYSGGPMMLVFEQRERTFVEIADMQGTIYFGIRVNGYREVVSQSRGGAGAYTRMLHRYEYDRYQPVRVADYQEAESGGSLKFVRERSPAQFRR